MKRLTVQNREAAAKAMALAAYLGDLNLLAGEMKAFMQEAFDYIIKPGAAATDASGVDDLYLCKASMFRVRTKTVNKARKASGSSYYCDYETLDWEYNPYLASNDIPGIWTCRHNDRTLYLRLEGNHTVPRGFEDTVLLDLEEHGSDPYIKGFAERLKELNKKQVKLIKEAQKYQEDVLSCLKSLNTLKQVEATFPVALEYLPKPESNNAYPVPVDLINSLTAKLHQQATA